MAAALGTTRRRYQDMEKAEGTPKKMWLGPHEWCRVMRWRAGKFQWQVAEDLKLTRSWVNRMEKGLENCDTLLWYWEQ